MKILIVYYSRTGTTRKIADKLADKLKADKEELIDRKSRKGIISYIIAGKDSIMKKLTKINEISKNPKNYELLMIGSPVWAGSLTPAVRTFLTKIKNYDKKVAFFSTAGGAGFKNTFRQMKELLPNSKLVTTLYLKSFEIRSEKKQEEKIKIFIDRLKND